MRDAFDQVLCDTLVIVEWLSDHARYTLGTLYLELARVLYGAGSIGRLFAPSAEHVALALLWPYRTWSDD